MRPRIRAHRLLRLLLAMLALAAGLCRAAADADLKPVPDESPLYGRLGAMGLVLVGEPQRWRSLGSGFLISACHVLTAGHVLTREGETPRRGTSVRFVPGLGNGAGALGERALRGDVVAAGADFVSKGASSEFDLENATRDWALIELEQPVADVQPFKMLHPATPLAAGTPLAVAGYALDPHRLFLNIHENCGVRPGFHGTDWLPGVLIVDCAVRTGMSGGPLLFEGGGQLVAVGIVVERVEVGERGEKIVAVVVSTRSFAERVAPVMQASRVCTVEQPFARPSKSAPGK